MLVNILKTMDAVYNPCQLRKIHSPVDSTNSVRICGLYTDFQLDQPRTHGAHQFQFIFPQQICGNLKVEIGNSIIMVFYVLPDGHCMIVPAIKGSVHKFHLWHFCINKKLQFPVYKRKTAKPQLLVYRRQAVTAGKRAATAGFVINDPVFKILQIRITKWKFVHGKQAAQGLDRHRSIPSPIGNTVDFFQ